MKALIRFNRLTYIAGRFFIPSITLVVVFYMLIFFISPLRVYDCIAVSGLVLFAASVIDGFAVKKVFYASSTFQIIAVKAGSGRKYDFAVYLFLAELSAAYTMLILIFPYAEGLFRVKRLSRVIAVWEFVLIFIGHFLISLCGYIFGSILHGREALT